MADEKRVKKTEATQEAMGLSLIENFKDGHKDDLILEDGRDTEESGLVAEDSAPEKLNKPLASRRIRVVEIERSRIIPDPNQVRQCDASVNVERIRKSIEDNGLREPLKVRELPDGRYLIVDGQCRWEALEGNERYASIPCVVMQEAESKLWSLTANLMRDNMAPLDKAEALKRYMVLRGKNADGSRRTDAEIGADFGKTRGWVVDLRKLSRLPEEIVKTEREDKEFRLGIEELRKFSGKKAKQDPEANFRAYLEFRRERKKKWAAKSGFELQGEETTGEEVQESAEDRFSRILFATRRQVQGVATSLKKLENMLSELEDSEGLYVAALDKLSEELLEVILERENKA